jgi:hypothetical protein
MHFAVPKLIRKKHRNTMIIVNVGNTELFTFKGFRSLPNDNLMPNKMKSVQ